MMELPGGWVNTTLSAICAINPRVDKPYWLMIAMSHSYPCPPLKPNLVRSTFRKPGRLAPFVKVTLPSKQAMFFLPRSLLVWKMGKWQSFQN